MTNSQTWPKRLSKLVQQPIFHKLFKAQLKIIPEQLNTRLVCLALNHLLHSQALAQSINELNGKIIGLVVNDLNRRFYIMILNGQLHNVQNPLPTQADIRICADLENFRKLVLRLEDPDTLFFQRKLTLEGNTETGLLIKNLLDSIDYDWSCYFKSLFENKRHFKKKP